MPRRWFLWLLPSALAVAVGSFVVMSMSDVAPTTRLAPPAKKPPVTPLECEPGDTGKSGIFDYIYDNSTPGHRDPRAAAASSVEADAGSPVSPEEFVQGPTTVERSEQHLVRHGRVFAVVDVRRVPGGGWMATGMTTCLNIPERDAASSP